jgi:hypothetical protein
VAQHQLRAVRGVPRLGDWHDVGRARARDRNSSTVVHDVPIITALPIIGGNLDYLAWVLTETPSTDTWGGRLARRRTRAGVPNERTHRPTKWPFRRGLRA